MISIGYDIGSSSVKTVLFDAEKGKELAHVSYPENEMEISSPRAGWAEQNPADWWEAVVITTQKILRHAGISPGDIKAAGISYQMHGLVIVDKNMDVLRPSIIWCDSRAVRIGERAFHDLGEQKCLGSLLNSPGNFTASKLKWVMENERSVYDNIFKIMLPGDYIAMKLTGTIATTNEGLSEGILWDFIEDKPADFIPNYFGFEHDIFPGIVPAFGFQGKVSSKASSQTGLPEGIPVTYRAGDQPNNAFSLNVLHPGEIAAAAGTSGVVYGVSDEIKFDPLGRVNTFLHVNHSSETRRLGILLCINGTGIANNWIRRTLFNSEISYEDMNRMAEKVDIGSEGLLFLPFGNGAERMLQNEEIGSSFSCLNFNIHTKEHILRAVLEGVAFSFNYGINILKELAVHPNVIRAGMSNMFLSKTFRETLANLSGSSIQLYNTDGALGAARAAAFGAGFYSSLNDAFQDLDCLLTVEPDTRLFSQYQSVYEEWLSLLNSYLNNKR